MSSRTKAFEAAAEIFAEKGKYGARMEEIAARAGINKALLYYYFSNKENLFNEVFTQLTGDIYKALQDGLDGFDVKNKPQLIFEKLLKIYFTFFNEKPTYARILAQVLANEPLLFREALTSVSGGHITKELDVTQPIFEKAQEKGIFRDVLLYDVMIHLWSVTMVHFMARPLAETLLDRKIETDLEDRFVKAATDLFLNGILRDETPPSLV